MNKNSRIWISLSVIVGLILILVNSCKKNEVPVVTTTIVSNIKATTAISGGNITDEGSSKVTARGVCWNTNTPPAIADNKTNDGVGAGSFISSITGLNANVEYFVSAYAINNAGVGYGPVLSFKTYAIADIDGNIYDSVIIGNQCWMVENLKVTKYRNGDLIGTTTPDTLDISGKATPKYQWAYDGNESSVAIYGRLYTWYVVTDSRTVCPTGWHVPTDAEWTTLSTYLGGESVAGGKLKETGTTHWLAPNTGATNESGFTAFPGGLRYDLGFASGGYCGQWWSSTEDFLTQSWARMIDYSDREVGRSSWIKRYGLSVRCLKDN